MKKKKIPTVPELEFLSPYLGPCKKASTREEKLMEFIDGELMFDGFPGFEAGVFFVAETLDEYGINPKSKKGQNILKTYVEHVLDEWYGDFDHFRYCSKCNKEFSPVYSLEYANKVLQDKTFCVECSKKAEEQNT